MTLPHKNAGKYVKFSLQSQLCLIPTSAFTSKVINIGWVNTVHLSASCVSVLQQHDGHLRTMPGACALGRRSPSARAGAESPPKRPSRGCARRWPESPASWWTSNLNRTDFQVLSAKLGTSWGLFFCLRVQGCQVLESLEHSALNIKNSTAVNNYIFKSYSYHFYFIP